MKFLFLLKRLFQIFLVVLLFAGIWNYKLINYAVSQAKGQLKIIWNVESIDEVMERDDFPDSLKLKLQLIQEIKKYAEDSLGINQSTNYSTFYNQNGRTLMWMLMASAPFEMKAKEWHFPFLGDFSYKGYFNKRKAQMEQYELIQQGYDTELGKASGWSTLGWFKDPILSSMLYYPKGQLASLIIHELTHGTLYVKNNVDFNENLASFIGEKGAQKFLRQKYGQHSEELINFETALRDERVFERFLVACTSQLKALYKTFNDEPEEQKLKKKKALIFKFVVDAYKLPLARKNKFAKRMRGALQSGNAFFMDYQRYDAQKDSLEYVLKNNFQGNIGLYLMDLKTRYKSL